MYGPAAITNLRDKLGYELWVLDFLLEPARAGSKDTAWPGITYQEGREGVTISLSLKDSIGGGQVQAIIDAMCPLTFVTCYKVLDMLFEWVIEENATAGNIGRVPQRFAEKIPQVRGLSAASFPGVMQADPDLRQYLLALYDELLDYRNEIVHRRKFAAANGALSIGPTQNGRPELRLDHDELGVLARVVFSSVRYVAGDARYGPYETLLVRHDLDRIQKCHRLSPFGVPEPVLRNVRFVAPGDGTCFPADLTRWRREMAAMHPGRATFLNLEVVGTVDGRPRYAWRFPYDRVPDDAVCELRPDSYSEYAVPISEIKLE